MSAIARYYSPPLSGGRGVQCLPSPADKHRDAFSHFSPPSSTVFYELEIILLSDLSHVLIMTLSLWSSEALVRQYTSKSQILQLFSRSLAIFNFGTLLFLPLITLTIISLINDIYQTTNHTSNARLWSRLQPYRTSKSEPAPSPPITPLLRRVTWYLRECKYLLSSSKRSTLHLSACA
jgi:hypothetical protein